MKKIFSYILISLFFIPLVFTALVPIAHGAPFNLVPCDGVAGASTKTCDLNAFVTLVKNVVNALIILSIPLTTVALVAVGIMILTAGGNTGRIETAKGIAWKVLIGFIFVLSAWLIVHTLIVFFVDPKYNLYLK